jgi:23S rRNA (cytidine1920-2'-O)/16S rRNA (cytidine1409-2'-O)-methyltransferase
VTPARDVRASHARRADPAVAGEPRVRLDRALVERGLARSRTQAQALIRQGRVRLAGSTAVKASDLVGPADPLDAQTEPYVSRAAYKLLGALDDLGLRPAGRALDAGASTGGFTQVLLHRGCAQVYAVDVGTDQLDPGLRGDPRVHVREQTNLRDLTLKHLDGEPVDLVVADVSFISLTLLLAPLAAITRPDGDWLLMVKPQFEVGREALGRGGVVRDPALHLAAVTGVCAGAERLGRHLAGATASRLPGPAGNREFFVHLTTRAPDHPVELAAALRPPDAG